VIVDDELEEVAQHLLGHVEVGDDAVLHGTHGDDALGRPSEHALCLEADTLDLLGLAVNRDDGRLVEDDSFALDVHERVGRAQIDTDRVRGKQASRLEERPAHLSLVKAFAPLQRTSRARRRVENAEYYPRATTWARHWRQTR